MSAGWSDTSPDAEKILLGLARSAPPWRKVELLGEMYRAARELALSGLRLRHPEDTPEELKRRLASILLGEELARRAYGPSLEEQTRDAV